MTGKGLENRKFAGRERNDFAVLLENARAEIELKVAEADDFVLKRRRARRILARTAAQHGVNAGKELTGIKGFAEVVVGAELETQNAVDILAAGSEHDDRGRILFRAQALQNGKSVFARHHEVENQHVEVLAHPEALHRLAVFAHKNREAVFTEIPAQKIAQPGVIVDDKNLGGAFNHLFAPDGEEGRSGRASRYGLPNEFQCLNCFTLFPFASPSGNSMLQIRGQRYMPGKYS